MDLPKLLDPGTFLNLRDSFKKEILLHQEQSGSAAEQLTSLVNFINERKTGILHRAIANSDYALISELMRIGVNLHSLDEYNRTTLWYVADSPLQMENLLRIFRGDINHLDQDGQTVLFRAVWSDNIRTVKILLGHGASTAVIDDDGYDCLEWAVANYCKTVLSVLADVMPVEPAYELACQTDDKLSQRVLELYRLD